MMRRAPEMTRTLSILLLLLLALVVVNAAAGRAADASPAPWQGKVAPEVLETITSDEAAEFIVFMVEQADVSGARELQSKEAKGQLVYKLLSETAAQSQRDLLLQLDEAGASTRSYWIANMVWVYGDETALRIAADSPEVAHVYANTYRQLQLPQQPPVQQPDVPQVVEENISHIRAPELWALGADGQGAVIGGQDTGYDWDHPALINQYRGWNRAAADHNYNWHDAIHSDGGVCGADSVEPCDDNRHGTHTMGTMVGDDGAGNQIGVAPGAKWIGCRNMDRGVGSPVTYSECFQWFVAPTDANGENPDVAMAPHVVNNSWACPPQEECDEVDVLQTVVENVRAAGIMVVASAGNSGPGCESVQYPTAIYDSTFSVGATSNSDVITSFSSRGPVTVDDSNRLKPDIVAPGLSIRSSIPGGHYGFSSGTSMAAPHVSGLVALLISAQPALVGDVSTLESLITSSAVPLVTDENCGGVSGEEIPNNTFGYGRIDAVQAYEALQLPVPYWYFIPFSLTP